MKKKKLIVFIGISILIIIAIIIINNYYSKGNKITYKNITDDEAVIQLKNDSSIILLDVRSEEEHNIKHIPGSILINVNDLESKVENEIKDKKKKIFVYCESGLRAKIAAQTLVDLGYENVYNLGGIRDWDYEIE